MVRNPYNRFYSAAKEVKSQFVRKKKVGFIKIPYALIDKDGVKGASKKTFIQSICPWTYAYNLQKLFTVSANECCKQILSFKRSKQDLFIRSKKNPWLNPQSYFRGKDVEVFYYESKSDWGKLLNIFGLSEYQDRLSIAKDYIIPDDMYAMIEKMYPEDVELFRKYKY